MYCIGQNTFWCDIISTKKHDAGGLHWTKYWMNMVLVGDGDLQMIANKFWCEYVNAVPVTTFVYSFSFPTNWSI